MNTTLENLLERLEDVSGKAVEMTDPSLAETHSSESSDLISERGTLLNGLNEALAGSVQPSYLDWNRLLIIHRQGTQIEANLSLTRDNLAAQLAENAQGRAFLNCLVGAVEEHRTPHQISI